MCLDAPVIGVRDTPPVFSGRFVVKWLTGWANGSVELGTAAFQAAVSRHLLVHWSLSYFAPKPQLMWTPCAVVYLYALNHLREWEASTKHAPGRPATKKAQDQRHKLMARVKRALRQRQRAVASERSEKKQDLKRSRTEDPAVTKLPQDNRRVVKTGSVAIRPGQDMSFVKVYLCVVAVRYSDGKNRGKNSPFDLSEMSTRTTRSISEHQPTSQISKHCAYRLLFKKSPSDALGGVIPLQEALLEPDLGNPNVFSVHTPERRFEIRTNTPAECRDWFQFIDRIVRLQAIRTFVIRTDAAFGPIRTSDAFIRLDMSRAKKTIDISGPGSGGSAKGSGWWAGKSTAETRLKNLLEFPTWLPSDLYIPLDTCPLVKNLATHACALARGTHRASPTRPTDRDGLDDKDFVILRRSSREWSHVERRFRTVIRMAPKEQFEFIAWDSPHDAVDKISEFKEHKHTIPRTPAPGRWAVVTSERLLSLAVTSRQIFVLDQISVSRVQAVWVECHPRFCFYTLHAIATRPYSPRADGPCSKKKAGHAATDTSNSAKLDSKTEYEAPLSSQTAIKISVQSLDLAMYLVRTLKRMSKANDRFDAVEQLHATSARASYKDTVRAYQSMVATLPGDFGLVLPPTASLENIVPQFVRSNVKHFRFKGVPIVNVILKAPGAPQTTHTQLIRLKHETIRQPSTSTIARIRARLFGNQANRATQALGDNHTCLKRGRWVQCVAILTQGQLVYVCVNTGRLVHSLDLSTISQISASRDAWHLAIDCNRERFHALVSNGDIFALWVKVLWTAAYLAKSALVPIDKKTDTKQSQVSSSSSTPSSVKPDAKERPIEQTQINASGPFTSKNKQILHGATECSKSDFFQLQRVHCHHHMLRHDTTAPVLHSIAIRVVEVQVARPIAPTAYRVRVFAGDDHGVTRSVSLAPVHEITGLLDPIDSSTTTITNHDSMDQNVGSALRPARLLVNETFEFDTSSGRVHGLVLVLYSRGRPLIRGLTSSAPWKYVGLAYIPLTIIGISTVTDGWFRLDALREYDQMDDQGDHISSGDIIPNQKQWAPEVRIQACQNVATVSHFCSIRGGPAQARASRSAPDMKEIQQHLKSDAKSSIPPQNTPAAVSSFHEMENAASEIRDLISISARRSPIQSLMKARWTVEESLWGRIFAIAALFTTCWYVPARFIAVSPLLWIVSWGIWCICMQHNHQNQVSSNNRVDTAKQVENLRGAPKLERCEMDILLKGTDPALGSATHRTELRIAGPIDTVELQKGHLTGGRRVLGGEARRGVHYGWSGDTVWVAQGYHAHMHVQFHRWTNPGPGVGPWPALTWFVACAHHTMLWSERLRSLLVWRHPIKSFIASALVLMSCAVALLLPPGFTLFAIGLLEIVGPVCASYWHDTLLYALGTSDRPSSRLPRFGTPVEIVPAGDTAATVHPPRLSQAQPLHFQYSFILGVVSNFMKRVPLCEDLYANELTIQRSILRESVWRRGKDGACTARRSSAGLSKARRPSLSQLLRSDSAMALDSEEPRSADGDVQYAFDGTRDVVVPAEAAPLDKYEQKMLRSLKETFKERNSNIHDNTMCRYIRGYRTEKDPVKTTRDRYEAMLTWREENGVDRVLRERPRGWNRFNALCQLGVLGTTRGHRPVYYERVGKYEPKKLKKYGLDAMMKCHVRLQEELVKLKQIISRRIGHRLYKHVVVVDLEGFGFRHMGQDVMGMLRKFAAVDGHMYPEGLERCYVVNAPWVFSTAWSLIKKFLHPLTQKRFVILGANRKKILSALSEMIDPSEVPTWLGGGNDSPLPGICSAEFENMMCDEGELSTEGGRADDKADDDMHHQSDYAASEAKIKPGERSIAEKDAKGSVSTLAGESRSSFHTHAHGAAAGQQFQGP